MFRQGAGEDIGTAAGWAGCQELLGQWAAQKLVKPSDSQVLPGLVCAPMLLALLLQLGPFSITAERGLLWSPHNGQPGDNSQEQSPPRALGTLQYQWWPWPWMSGAVAGHSLAVAACFAAHLLVVCKG